MCNEAEQAWRQACQRRQPTQPCMPGCIPQSLHQPSSCLADRPVVKEERRHSGLKEERKDSGLKEERLKEERTYSITKEEHTKEERTHSITKEEHTKEERTHSIPKEERTPSGLKEEHRHSGEQHGHHAKEGLAAEGQRQPGGTATRLLDREGSAKFVAPRQGSAPCPARQAPGRGHRAHCLQLRHCAGGPHCPQRRSLHCTLQGRRLLQAFVLQNLWPPLWHRSWEHTAPKAGCCTLPCRRGVLLKCPLQMLPRRQLCPQCLECSLPTQTICCTMPCRGDFWFKGPLRGLPSQLWHRACVSSL